MEYGNCKNLPLWAEILLKQGSDRQEEAREESQQETDYEAAAA